MSNYDKQYDTETELFGSPYREFEDFVKVYAVKGAKALDVGCGQGRDALMLAQYGYEVTGVDSSKVGIDQMIERANDRSLQVKGVVTSFYDFELNEKYDAIVLDSILHFEKADRKKELELIHRLFSQLNLSGYMFIFIHKSPQKEQELHDWLSRNIANAKLVKDGYIDYVYEEKSINFKSEFKMYMFILQRISMA